MRADAAADADVRSSWIWALGASSDDASDVETRANARERTVGARPNDARDATRGRATRLETREKTSTTARRAMEHRARVVGRRGRPFGAHVGDYSSSSSSASDDDASPRPNARPPPRPNARYPRRGMDDDARMNGSRTAAGREASTSTLRAMTAEAARFRDELARERARRNRADAALDEATRAGESLRREHAALTHSHERLKEARDKEMTERKRQIRGLKKRLTETTARESRQRRRSVAALKMALDALRAFAPTAPNGRALGGSAVSAVIGELSALTEAIALRDCVASDDDATAAATAFAARSSWDVAETERAKARADALERELEDAHEIIRIAEKERVVLERELAAARREIDAQASRHDDELREATEATARAIAIVRAREEESNTRVDANTETDDAVEDAPSPRAPPPPSPRAGDLRGDMDALERELSQLTQSMRAALAEVDGVAP